MRWRSFGIIFKNGGMKNAGSRDKSTGVYTASLWAWKHVGLKQMYNEFRHGVCHAGQLVLDYLCAAAGDGVTALKAIARQAAFCCEHNPPGKS